MSSNKISDLLNNDQPQQLHTIAESSPTTATHVVSFPPISNPIKTEVEPRPSLQESADRAAFPYSDSLPYGASTEFREPQPSNRPPSGAWEAPNSGNRPPPSFDKVSAAPHHVDRRASDSAAMRPKFEAPRPVPPPLDFAGSAKPTTFDGSGSTVSPTFARQPSFHSRTSSLGASSGNYAQEARNAVVPPQMSSRRDSQRELYKPHPPDSAPGPPPSNRPGEDFYSRRSEPSTPVERQYHHYVPPHLQYPPPGGYQQPWHRQPPPPGLAEAHHHSMPAYSVNAQQSWGGQAGRYGSPPQSQPQERDVWRHHSYARGGRR